jgi:hemin uptake protein HemP
MSSAGKGGYRIVCDGSRADPRPQRRGLRVEIAISSGSLMQGQREIVIRHAGHDYRLRVTANDKLILTK